MAKDRTSDALFLCTENSACSLLAEAILSRVGQGRFRAFSAGSVPRGEVNPYALNRLRVGGDGLSRFRSKHWQAFSRPGAREPDFAITLSDCAAGEPCPAWPGQPMTAHRGLPDPAAAEGGEAEKHAAFAETMRMLDTRLGIFVNLPVASPDPMALKERLEAIGRSGDR